MLTLTQKTLKNAAAATAGKNDGYCYLQDVCVRDGYIYGTNAHILYKGKNALIHKNGIISKDDAKKGKIIFSQDDDGRFPNVNNCIPNDSELPYLVEVERNDFLACAEALKKFVKLEKLTSVMMVVHPTGGLTLKAESVEHPSIVVNCNSHNFGFDSAYIIHFNVSYLVTALKGFDKYDLLKIGFNKKNLRPFKISKAYDQDQLYIITPIRTY